MVQRLKVLTDRSTILLLYIVLLAAAPLFTVVPSAYAVTNLKERYDKVSDPGVSAIATHEIGFRYTDFAVPIGSVLLEFCSNDPLPGNPCTAPSGFDLTASTILAQTGETGFSKHASSNQNQFILTRPASLPTVGPSTYTIQNVTNPDYEGTYYIRLQSFTSTDATGIAVEEGGVALSTNTNFSVSTEVPPHLTFCVSVTITAFDCSSANSFYIDFGEFSKTNPETASSQMVAATNAGFGYSIFASGTTFTSGNNTIPAPLAPTTSQPGTSQFGINLRSNTQPSIGQDPVGPGSAGVTANYNVPNSFMYVSGDSVASAVNSQDYKKFTVTYLVNVAQNQPPGVYATTLTYICLANF